MTTTNKKYQNSKYLVETDWLEQHLGDDDLRIFDCTVSAAPDPDPNTKYPFKFTSGIENFNDGHIPGAGFLDLLGDLSDTSSELPFLLPPLQQFTRAIEKAASATARALCFMAQRTRFGPPEFGGCCIRLDSKMPRF